MTKHRTVRDVMTTDVIAVDRNTAFKDIAALLAKDAGVAPEGSGSHRIAIGGTAPFTDLDGFAWETAAIAATH